FVHLEEEMNASESGPLQTLISCSRRATRASASSQLASRNLLSISRISGLVSRSELFTKSHANFPFMQVEMPLAGPSDASTFKICRSFVQMLKLQPTPQ